MWWTYRDEGRKSELSTLHQVNGALVWFIGEGTSDEGIRKRNGRWGGCLDREKKEVGSGGFLQHSQKVKIRLTRHGGKLIQEPFPEFEDHIFDPPVTRWGRVRTGPRRQSSINVFCPKDRNSETENLVPPDWRLRLDENMGSSMPDTKIAKMVSMF